MFSTGYVANVSTISGLLNRHDYVVLDKDAHNSLLTGANLSGATMKRFGHNDLERLTKILDQLPRRTGQGRHRRRRLLDGRRHRAARRDGRALPALHQHVPARRRSARSRRAGCAWPGRGRAPRRARRDRSHHHHLLQDPRFLRWRADRLGRRHRVADARRRSADLHRVEHPGFDRRRARGRCASCATTPT